MLKKIKSDNNNNYNDPAAQGTAKNILINGNRLI